MALATTEGGLFLYEPDGAVLEAYLADRSRLSVVQGPVGSGTSSASCHKLWMIANEQRPDVDGVRRTRWIVSRATYKELRDTTLPTWLEWFPEAVWGSLERSEPMRHTLRRPHWSGDGTTTEAQVVFLALPDAMTAKQVLASFEITGFFQNEAQFVEKGVTTLLLSRCARYPSMKNGPGATWYGGFIDMNAPEEGHWVPYMRGDVPLPRDWTDDQKAEFKRPRDWRFFVQPPGLLEKKVDGEWVYEPNPKAENQKWLKQTYLERIQGWSKRQIDQLVLNKVMLSQDGQPVYPTFNEVDHVLPKDAEALAGFPLVVGLDFGRQPAALIMQNRSQSWYALAELIGDNESAQLFAPRLKRFLAQRFPGFEFEFYGDPRGADGTQATEATAYDIFRANGMRVRPATTDNNPEMRRSTMEKVLERRRGLLVNPSCTMFKTGMAGGYHYKRIQGSGGVHSDKPAKNGYSHIVEAGENALLGGGEGWEVVHAPNVHRLRPSPVVRPKVMFRGR